jgi:hypothetical protein
MIWYLQSHFVWLRLSYSSIAKLPFVRVVAHDWKSPRWTTARKVKLLLPPRQSRGISLVISAPHDWDRATGLVEGVAVPGKIPDSGWN